MNQKKIKRYLKGYILSITTMPANDLFGKIENVIDELSIKLSKAFSSEKEIEEYLDFIFDYMENLNDFFKKKGSGRIPYTRLFNFANKDEKLQEFKFDKNIEKKKGKINKTVGVAGYAYENDEESEVNIIYGDDVYSLIYHTRFYDFFFSTAIHKLVVRNAHGKIITYKKYSKILKKKEINGVKIKEIYKAIKKSESRTEAMKSFCRTVKESVKRKKNG